jgi:tetratricopeptide (TPR) repeat protein
MNVDRLAFTVWILSARPATAAAPKEPAETTCYNATAKTKQEAVAPCTALIESKTAGSEERAKAYYARGNWNGGTAAVADYTEALKLKPDYEAALMARGATVKWDDPQKAMADFSAVIALKPKAFGAYAERGFCELALGQYAEAVKDFDSAMKYADEGKASALWLLWRGFAEDAAGDHLRAIHDFSACVKNPFTDPRHALHARGVAFYEKGDFANAFEDFDKAIKLRPDDKFFAETWYARGLTRRRRGDDAGANADIAAAKAMDAEVVNAFEGSGLPACEFGSPRGLCDEAIRAKPQSAATLYLLAKVRRRAGDFAGGASDEARAKKLDPKIGGTFKGLPAVGGIK